MRISVGLPGGEAISLTGDATLKGDDGRTFPATELKEFIHDEPTGWFECRTTMEIHHSGQPEFVEPEESEAVIRVRNLWVAYVAEEQT